MSLLGSLAKMAITAGKMLSEADNKVSDVTRPENEPTTQQLYAQAESDARPFDEKLKEVLAGLGNVSVQEFVPVDEVETPAGKQIYTRGGNRCAPEAFSYKLMLNGKFVYIRLWKYYSSYNHSANREIKEYCDKSGIKVLDFFEYLPNGVNYMRERIGSALN